MCVVCIRVPYKLTELDTSVLYVRFRIIGEKEGLGDFQPLVM